MTPEFFKILAVGDRVWGKGDTVDEAVANMKKSGKSKAYILYIVHPESRVHEDGAISWPTGFVPKEIHRVGLKKKAAS